MQNYCSNYNRVLKEQLIGPTINQKYQYKCEKNIDPRFQGENRLFVLLFENEDDRTVHTEYYLPKVEMKNYNL